MSRKRLVEIYTADCPVCSETVNTVRNLTCPSCEVVVLDLHEPAVAGRAAQLSMRSVPTVVVDGVVSACCAGRGVSEKILRAAGVGQPL